IVRRAVNPRYRPPVPRVAQTRLAPPRQNGFDHVYVQASGRGLGSDASTGDGHILLERMYGDTDRLTFDLNGYARQGIWGWRDLHAEGRRGPWLGDLGDLPAFAPVPELNFHASRGVFAGRDLPQGGVLAFTAGAPSPWATGDGAQFVSVSGTELRTDSGRLTAVASGFHWADGRFAGSSAWTASLGQQTPFLRGTFGTAFSLQRHDLDGPARSAAALAVDWRTLRPTYALSMRVRRASEETRVLTGEEADHAPHQELNADGQTRFWHSRAELHSSFARFAGGDSTRNWQSTQIGGSSQIGPSAWYAGWHASWNLPGASPQTVRQINTYAGRSGGSGVPLLLRVQQTYAPGSDLAWEVSGETNFALRDGARVSVEPIAEWREQKLDRAGLWLGGNRPLPWPGARLTARLRLEVDRAGNYHPGVSEASLAITLRPRPRDTWEVEMRQGGDYGGYELTSTYDLQQARYEGVSSASRRRDASAVAVRVERADGTGVEGVLVALDGKDLRYTDGNGDAAFEGVPPGVHEMSVEERTLPDSWYVAGPTRVLFSVEKGVAPIVPRFKIARLEKRTKF
ncbi:MAG TPA: hypothetical protein VKF80_09445, partial [Candidatus Eisenbacteria bacterium]|nr:hypothetical protein [Candidatus Eisenbacteria bacterium]